jgi:hypothetical protein
MEETVYDDIGRMFCKEHRRAVCHVCGFDFQMMNEDVEANAGLRKKKSEVEQVAEDFEAASVSLNYMRQQGMTGPMYEQAKQYYDEAQTKLRRLEGQGQGHDVQAALEKAAETTRTTEANRNALMQAWAKENPGKRVMEVGGEDTQRLFDQFVAPPPTNYTHVEKFTCSYCDKSSATKLLLCGRCKRVSYCGKECQTVAWKAHKAYCVPTEGKKPKSLPLTWAQVEAAGGRPVTGRTLEVRAIVDESMMRQVFSCKDRTDAVRRVAAYTSSRGIPGLKQGAVLRWKNPRFKYFLDGSSGARIEEEDLRDVTVSDT